MSTLLFSLHIGLCIFLIFLQNIQTVYAALTTLLVILITYFLFARSILKQVQTRIKSIVLGIQKKQIHQGIPAFLNLKYDFRYCLFSADRIIDTQIGILYYLCKDFKSAKIYLKKSLIRDWTSQCMLAILAFKHNDFNNMDRIFKVAAYYSPRQELLWSIWAFCHQKIGNKKKAINILTAGKLKLSSSRIHLDNNLFALKTDKRMKMEHYGQQWHQFHIEETDKQPIKRVVFNK